jgi:hypothetical protein
MLSLKAEDEAVDAPEVLRSDLDKARSLPIGAGTDLVAEKSETSSSSLS